MMWHRRTAHHGKKKLIRQKCRYQTDNLKLVAQILDGMDADSRAAILGKMTSDTAAKVTEIMKPSE